MRLFLFKHACVLIRVPHDHLPTVARLAENSPHANANIIQENNMGYTLYRHQDVFIKTMNLSAVHAALFAHSGIKRSHNAYATSVIVADNRKRN